MTYGGKLPEIAQMLTESTGRVFQHHEVHNVVKKLQKRFLLTDDPAPGEEEVEIEGLEILAQQQQQQQGDLLEVASQQGDKVMQVGYGPYYGREWRREILDS